MSFSVRPMEDADRMPWRASSRPWPRSSDGIASEPPVDVEVRASRMTVDGGFVAVADGQVIGSIDVMASRHGFGEIGTAILRGWRGRGVGNALMEAAIDWSRERGLHKLSLGVRPHNEAAIALYRKLGFVEEGRRIKHMRPQSGELWDIVDMGLLL